MKFNAAFLLKMSTGAAVIAAMLILSGIRADAQDRNLDFYVSTGLGNSPLLKDYMLQVTAGGLDSQRIRAGFRPQVTGISSDAYAPVVNGWGYDQALTNGASFTEMVNVSQAFVGKSNLAAQFKGISIVNDSLRNAQKLSEQELKRNITAQYITAFGDQQQLGFYAEVNTILRNQEIILKKLTENNIYRQTDYLTFLVTLKQQELQWKQLQIQYRTDLSMLNYLCGIPDTAAATLGDPGIVLQQLPDTSASAFFQAFRTNQLKFENEISQISYSYKPKLSAFANAGYSSSLAYQAYKNFGTGFGLNLSVPIYDGHQRRLLEHKIKLSEAANSNYKDFFTRQYSQQLAMLHQQLRGTASLTNDINDQIKYAEGLIKINGKLLETGDAKIADLVIAISNYLAAKNLLTQNNISRMQIVNQINYWNR